MAINEARWIPIAVNHDRIHQDDFTSDIALVSAFSNLYTALVSSEFETLAEEVRGRWDHPLFHWQGTYQMRGIDVFADFPWEGRRTFVNCKNLSHHANDATQNGKRPALLLTDKEDGGFFETQAWRVFAINYGDCTSRYLDHRAAYSYLWQDRLKGKETLLAGLNDLSSEDLDELASHVLTPERVVAYLSVDPKRLETVLTNLATTASPIAEGGLRAWVAMSDEAKTTIKEIAKGLSEEDHSSQTVSLTDIARALESLKECDPETIEGICKFLSGVASDEDRLKVLRNLMASPDGAALGGQVVGETLVARLEHLEAKAKEYNELILSANETQMQRFIQENTWLLSLDYARVMPQASAGRGNTDLLVEKFDGTHDIVELKGPGDDVIEVTAATLPAAPHDYHLGGKLANAIAQGLAYKIQGQANNPWLPVHTTPSSQVIVVVGLRSAMDETKRLVFDELRKQHLHHFTIFTYDEVGQQALNRVAKIRECLGLTTSQE